MNIPRHRKLYCAGSRVTDTVLCSTFRKGEVGLAVHGPSPRVSLVGAIQHSVERLRHGRTSTLICVAGHPSGNAKNEASRKHCCPPTVALQILVFPSLPQCRGSFSRSPLPTRPPCRTPQPRLRFQVCAARTVIWKSLRSCLVRLRLSGGELAPRLSKVGFVANHADFSQVGDEGSSQEYLSRVKNISKLA